MAIVVENEQRRWRSRGGDPAIESFYTTEYSSRYTRPATVSATTRSISGAPAAAPTTRHNTGFASNNHVSPLELAPLEDRKDYRNSHSHEVLCAGSSVEALRTSKPICRAAMEKSGYWNEPTPNVLYETPAMRKQSAIERKANAESLDKLTLKRMSKKNPIDGENGGAGPEWGSTSSGTAFVKYESNHDKFWRTDRSLIGKCEHNGYTRGHITVPQDPIDEQKSIYSTSYRKPERPQTAAMPDRVVMEKSGFTYSSIPTQTKNIKLSDVTADDLPSLTIHRMKHKNTTEYQNLYDPDPWKTTSQMSYKPPERTTERATTAGCAIRRGRTGFNSNETITAGAPGDPRWAKTGKTEAMKKFKDPTPILRQSAATGARPNVMERSGYWAK